MLNSYAALNLDNRRYIAYGPCPEMQGLHTLGPMRFMQAIRLINVSPTAQALIDRAITQRMQSKKAQTRARRNRRLAAPIPTNSGQRTHLCVRGWAQPSGARRLNRG